MVDQGCRFASDPTPSHTRAVPYHRFKVGQTVVAPAGGPHALIPRGPHIVVRLMPLIGREPRYRVRSTVDGHERVVPEGQIKLTDAKLSEQ